MGFLETFGAFILVLGILVFAHELGHFLVAKSFGIRVEVFSLGIGPRLVGIRRGDTDYRISLLPLGGYVKLAGEEPGSPRSGSPDEFLARPRWQRLCVFAAGAAFNIALALAITWAVFLVWGKEEAKISEAFPVVAAVQPGSPAEQAGIQVGDRIVEINGRDARLPETRRDEVLFSPGQVKPVVVEREGRRLTLEVNMGQDPRYHLGFPGWSLVDEGGGPPVIASVSPDSPAEAAGLQPGDEVLAVEDREPVTELELRELLAKSPGVAIRLKIRRQGRVLESVVTPRNEGGRGLIGVLIRSGNVVHRELGPLEAAREAVAANVELGKVLFVTLRRMIRGDISMRALSGPIEIARVSRQAVEGLQSFLAFLAFISLQLGILNLLPIPVLDGGHILILLVESLLRRDLSDRVKERVMQLGLVFLLAVFAVVIYFDIIKTFFSS